MKKNITWAQLFLVIIAMSIFAFGCAQKRGKMYTIARDPTWQPLNFEQNQGMINTYLASLLIQAAKKENFRVHLIEASSTQLFSGLEKGEYDAILSALPLDPMSEARYDFSNPIFALGPVLVVAKDSEIKNIEDLRGKIIGISPFDNTILIAQRVPDSIIRMYDSMPLALMAVEKQEIDGLLIGIVEAKQLTESMFKNTLKIASKPLNQEAIRLVVLKGENEELIKKINFFCQKNS